MNSISKIGAHSWLYGLSHFAHGSDIATTLTHDLLDSGLMLHHLQHKKVYISFLGEGHGHELAGQAVNYLQSVLPGTRFHVLFNSIESGPAKYVYQCYPWYMVNHMDWLDQLVPQDHELNRKFLCMMRRASPSRARLAQQLYQLPGMRLSFGSMSPALHLKAYRSMFDCELPICIDGATARDQPHNLTHPDFHTALFNVVVESSSQTDPEVWRSIFITEKTFKAFALQQIPIWFAVPGLVAAVRNLGFDLFDDIVDHRYDTINDEHQRMLSVVDQINQLDETLSLEQCQSLKKTLAPRFEHNWKVLQSARQNKFAINFDHH